MQKIDKYQIQREEDIPKYIQKLWEDHLAQEKNFSLLLKGGLGSGKTVWVRALLRFLGYTGNVPSPTYNYVYEYQTTRGHFAHFDCYRLQDNDFWDKGLGDIAADPHIQNLVEWSDNVPDDAKTIWSGTTYVLKFSHGVGAGMRTVEVLRR